jgi:hypothetical protein
MLNWMMFAVRFSSINIFILSNDQLALPDHTGDFNVQRDCLMKRPYLLLLKGEAAKNNTVWGKRPNIYLYLEYQWRCKNPREGKNGTVDNYMVL